MTTLEIWILAVGLAMDCFAVALTSGIILKRFKWKTMLTMALAFGFFQGFNPFIGWIGAKYFRHFIEHIDHWIAFGILAFLGTKMIIESFKKEENRHFNPERLKVILTLAVATSIDALAVGISFACIGMTEFSEILNSLLIIGWVSFLLTLVGLTAGIKCGKAIARKVRADLLGGIILIAIGVKVLIEHLNA